MKLIKLTTEAGSSKRGDVQWATGTTVSLPEPERRKTLCEKGLLHVYAGETVEHALALGLMMDPSHARIGREVRDSTKAGGWCFEVGEELEVTLPTREQRVRFAIYCAQTVVSRGAYPAWWKWAERWLDGSDRSAESAEKTQTAVNALALGLLMDPSHARIGREVRAFEVTGDLVARDATKAGGWCFRVGEELEVVVPTREQRVRYAIYCAQAVLPRDACVDWWAWSERWLDGSDRSWDSAAEAVPAVEVEKAAWWAARSAAWAAAWAAAKAAWLVAWWAAKAAVEAARAYPNLDLAELALRAIRDEAHDPGGET